MLRFRDALSAAIVLILLVGGSYAQTCCDPGYTWVSAWNVCLEDTGTIIGKSNGNVVMTAWTSGLNSIASANYIAPCGPVDSAYGSNWVVKMSMGSVTDYYRQASGALCTMLNAHNQHQWARNLASAFIVPSYYHTHLGGCAPDYPKNQIAGDPRRYISFWGNEGGKAGGCCTTSYSVYSGEWDRAYTMTIHATTAGAACVPEIDVNPTSLGFGEQNPFDGATATQSVTISNSGPVDLEVSNILLTGAHAGDFVVTGVPTLPHDVASHGGSLVLNVAFDPTSDGPKTASLDIVSNDANEGTVSVALSGTGGEGSPLLCEVSTATDPPTRFYRSSSSDTCQASPTTANSCYYPESRLAGTFPTELRIVGPNAQAPLFADPVSRLENDGSNDRIYVAFNLPTKYYNHSLVFADATDCGTWTLSDGFPTANTDSLDNCYLTYEWSQVWGDAYASDGSKCGWARAVDGNNVKLTLDFGVSATEDLGNVRENPVTRQVQFLHPMTVEFPTQVTAETASVQVFSPVRTLAAVVGQSVTVDESTDPDTATLTVTLSTEVQAPFELHGITSNTMVGGITLVTTLNGANDVNVRQEAECTNGALDCANTWQFQYSTQTTTTPCNFNGGYSVDFTIRCSDESDTNCPVDDATDSVTVSFTLASSDHCPTVIDSIVLNAELKVYDAPQRVTDADDFVGDGLQDDGQTAVNEGDADQWQVAYFTAPTTSNQVAILETEFNQVWVERGAADVTLLDKDNSLGGGALTCTATAYANADDTASCGTEAGLDSTTCQLVVPDVAFPDKCGACGCSRCWAWRACAWPWCACTRCAWSAWTPSAACSTLRTARARLRLLASPRRHGLSLTSTRAHLGSTWTTTRSRR